VSGRLQVSALEAVVGTLTRDMRDMLRNPLAFAGGMLGTAGCAGALVLVMVGGAGSASAEDASDQEELDIDFVPGALVKLGKKPPDEKIPEKIITQETRAPDVAAEPENAATEDETVDPTPKPDKKPDKESKLPPDPSQPKKDSKLPTSDSPTTKNTPYDDLPTVDYNVGDPFGSPDGWAERAQDGDPWATSVMAALNNKVKAGAFMAKGASGDFQFQISIGKDGKICDVNRKGGTLDAGTQASIELELLRLKLPTPPGDLLQKMRTNCAKIRYTFRWSANRGVQ
jgi:hypothetical protein